MRRNYSIQGDFDLVCGLALLVEVATPKWGSPKHQILNPKQYQITKILMAKTV
jgi:hypothetical protein